MLIINEKADFSTCGLGQIKYNVDTDVKELLTSVYSEITMEDMISFQTFIDAIGGLNGTIWGKLAHVYMYIFASNTEEAAINLITGDPVTFRPIDGQTNSLTCIHGEGIRVLSGKCFWPYKDDTRTSKPFGLIGRNLKSTDVNAEMQVLPTAGKSYKTGGTRLYTTTADNDHSIVLSNGNIQTSIAISLQSESDVTIVTDGVEVPNSNTTALPLSNNTAENKTYNLSRFSVDSIDYPYQFQIIGYNLTKAETIQIAAAANKMVL